ncbi:hypothetical protein [Nocardioides sp. GXQ0305]|uniref:hypothetical protein n=1 Tax=Nocardioides sp. GXQ0305 TaxID=3423912 RepID=UPI003D7E31D0
MHRRALTAALASASVALGGALAATNVPAQAADPESPLVLEAPDQVTVRAYDHQVFASLGIRMTAQGEDFEIQATRPETYDGPITATWKRESGDVDLGEMSSWAGLDRFARVRIIKPGRDRWITAAGCFNGSARKVGPAGPASNPYPWGCPWNPYTLGSVMGVAQDYSALLLPRWGTGFRVKPGRYQLVAFITPEWRERLGISDADGKVTTRLVVKKGQNRWRTSATPAARRTSAPPTAQRGVDDLEATTEAPTADSAGALADEFAPDLRSLPAFDISVNSKGTALRFGATVWNGGAGPMVIEGFRDDHGDEATRHDPGHEHSEHMTAYQYYFDGNGNQTGYDQVGEFNFHEGNHNHWHFEDFARYNLYGADAEGNRLDDVVVRSTKASFCLVATDAVDLTVPNADMRPEYTDLGSQCGGANARMLRQVLANGHGDTYHQFRTGQAFRLKNVEDGIYYIGVEANPDDADGRNLQELGYDNNDSFRKVRIGTRANGKRFVRPFQVGIIEESGFENFRLAR